MKHINWNAGSLPVLALALITTASAGAQLSEAKIDELAKAAMADLQTNGFTFSFTDLAGEVVSQGDERFEGKVLLVDIWGTWCSPCRREAPFLAALYETYKEQGLEMVGIAFEVLEDKTANIERIEKFLEESEPGYTILYGGQTKEADTVLPPSLARLGYPAVIIFDRKGVVRKVEAGFWDKSAENIETAVKELLEDDA